MKLDLPPYWLGDFGPYLHRPPDREPCCPQHDEGLSLEERRTAVAVHEAGHAATSFLLGVHIPSVGIECIEHKRECGQVTEVRGAAEAVDFSGHHALVPLTVLAAGVSANQRWLHDVGLWTERRAWHAEHGGTSDRQRAERLVRENLGQTLRFGTSLPGLLDDYDYWSYWSRADQVLAPVWKQLLVLAEQIAEAGSLSGDEAAEAIGLSNPSPIG